MNGSAYRPQLDGLRAICILLTVANHTVEKPFWINGGMGVDIFFALSGWLITWLILDEFETRGEFRLKKFYIRRFFRIVPMYVLTLLLYAVSAYVLVRAGRPEEWAEFLAGLPYLATFNGEYRPEAAGTLFGHAWTLGIEEKFYLVWPVILLLLSFRLPFAIAAAAVTVGLTIMLSEGLMLIVRGYCGLGFGAAAAILWRCDRLRTILKTRSLASLAFCGLIVIYIFSIVAPLKGVWNLSLSFCAAGLVAALWSRNDTIVARLLSIAPVAWVGKLTYGIYLVHVLCLNAVRMMLDALGYQIWAAEYLLGYGLSIMVAWITFVLLEKPLINIGRRLAQRPAVPAGLTPRVD